MPEINPQTHILASMLTHFSTVMKEAPPELQKMFLGVVLRHLEIDSLELLQIHDKERIQKCTRD